MKFIRASIYGFAKWNDFQIDFQPDELEVIYGENESGKSSLQQFILFMLFGLPPKKRTFFRSRTSGKMGGMLTIYEEEIGEYKIERVDEARNGSAKCLLPNGEEADEEWLKSRLNGMTRQTYRSIFSFDALDLTALKTMKEEDLGEILLGIGLTGSTDIYAVEKRLDSKINELFKPFGKKPVINQQLDYLEDLNNKVQLFKSHEKTYDEKMVKLVEINADLERLQQVIQMEKKNVSESDKIRQALPNLIRLNKYEDQLESYPEVIPFPKDGMNRWHAVKEKILPLQSELAVLHNNATSYNNKQIELKESLMDYETYDEVKRLVDTQKDYNEQIKEMKNLKYAIKEQEAGLKNELKNIDTKLEINDLDDISLAYQTENKWIQLYEGSQQLRIEKEKLTQEKAVQRKQKKELEISLDSLKDNQLTPKQVDELSNRIQDYNNYHYQEKENKQQANFKAIKNQKQKTSFNLFVGSALLGILFGLIGFLQGYLWGYGVMLVSIGVGIAQWIISKRSVQTMEQLFTNNETNLDDIPVTLEEKEEAEQLLADYDESLRQAETIADKLHANNIDQIKWQERHELTMQTANRIDEKIRHQRKLYPILETIDVSNWPSFYHTFKSLLQQNLDWRKKGQQLNAVIMKETQLRENVMKFFADKNWELDYKSIDACFAFLQEKVEEHDNKLHLIEQYVTWIETTDEQIEIMKQKVQVFQTELANLLKAAEVNTEEEFYQKNTLLEDKKKIEIKREEVMEQLSMIFSEEKIGELISNDMMDVTKIQEKQEDYRNKLELAEQEIEERRKQLAAINADLANMESSDEHSQTMHRFHLENDELKKLSEKWAILKSAKEMLLETKKSYREKYMTRMMEQTSAYFAILTNHAYTNVYAPTEEKLFQVESVDHLRYTVNELSQGTKDQLYIALRLAISEVMSDAHRMPFIIDDAFVHFDDIRVENMMLLIASIAKKRQVLLFTCRRALINNANGGKITVLSESVRKS
ncbi:AAA family ATPase [Virgibacillus necropolis]|uniref:ATP-binding protein n=1 Tax=Virgibacillus necropolis TaxID=163877 RepID=UPI00384C5597